jgi:uncharacterized membrane protein YdjX (TVP38/TMEM64 family)
LGGWTAADVLPIVYEGLQGANWAVVDELQGNLGLERRIIGQITSCAGTACALHSRNLRKNRVLVVVVKHLNTLWLVTVVLVLIVIALNPDLLNRGSIARFLGGLGASALLVYIGISLARALVMMPSTPFILAGAVAFPQAPILVFVISYIGVVAGTLLIYKFPSFGSYDEYLEEKYPKQIGQIKEKMQSRYSFWIVVGWSFFPLVPTDLISYVAGIAKMSLKKLVAAVIIGELPIVTFYVFAGVELGEWLRV